MKLSKTLLALNVIVISSTTVSVAVPVAVASEEPVVGSVTVAISVAIAAVRAVRAFTTFV
jgi:hypothetical protein